jgi:cell division protein ZapA (FtsZ GTPase activity inhibitor)
MDYDKSLLEDIYIAHVLILANQIKAEKKADHITRFGDYIDDAVREISLKKQRILQSRASSI